MTQREYRGKHYETGEWKYGSLLDGDIIVASGSVEVDGEYIGIGEWCSVDPDTVGQYTGLQDDQLAKVFLGDKVIQILTGKVYTVIWDDIGAGFLFSTDGEDESEGHAIDYYDFEDECSSFGFRVTGSIHDHPHLLNKEDA